MAGEDVMFGECKSHSFATPTADCYQDARLRSSDSEQQQECIHGKRITKRIVIIIYVFIDRWHRLATRLFEQEDLEVER